MNDRPPNSTSADVDGTERRRKDMTAAANSLMAMFNMPSQSSLETVGSAGSEDHVMVEMDEVQHSGHSLDSPAVIAENESRFIHRQQATLLTSLPDITGPSASSQQQMQSTATLCDPGGTMIRSVPSISIYHSSSAIADISRETVTPDNGSVDQQYQKVRTNLSLYTALDDDGDSDHDDVNQLTANKYSTATYLSTHSWDPSKFVGMQLPTGDAPDDNEKLNSVSVTSPFSPPADSGKKTAGSKLAASSERLGTVRGVLLPCLQNTLGIIVFLRLPWILGLAGVWYSLLIIALSTLCTLITVTSISAIVTNGMISNGGGVYYMISRVLGKDLGISVGLMFYLSLSISTALYVLGGVEILVEHVSLGALEFGTRQDHARVYGTALLIMLYIIAMFGMRWVNRVSMVFISFVFISLLSIYVGIFASGRSGLPREAVVGLPGNISDNFLPGYTKPDLNSQINPERMSFFSLFALFFPSVAGIVAGTNRMPLLKNPSKSIPRGTFSAIALGSSIYISLVLLIGSACTGVFLRTKDPQLGLHVSVFAWPLPVVALIGILFASIGAGLQCLSGAPRLFQAVAKDDVIPRMSFFAVTSKGEPTRALFATYVLAQLAVLIGDLDAVAPIITLLYLMCYALVNCSTALLDLFSYPNWRPTWSYYHWALSLFGALLCFTYMFLLQWIGTLIILILTVIMYKYIQYQGAQVQYGDGVLALNLSVAQNNLLALEKTRINSAKNWRPQIMVFLDLKGKETLSPFNPELLSFLSQLKKSGGLAIVTSVLQGQLRSKHSLSQRSDINEDLKLLLKKYSINGFTQVLMGAKVCETKVTALQSVGIGYLKPNTILLAYPDISRITLEETNGFVELIRNTIAMEQVIIILKSNNPDHPYPSNTCRPFSGLQTIDVYWIMHDGGILTLLPYILKKHRIWKRTRLRIFCIAQEEDNSVQMKSDLEALLLKFRIDAEAIIVELEGYDISEFTYEKTLHMQKRAELLTDLKIASQAELLVTAPINTASLNRRKPDKQKAEFMNTSVKLNRIFKQNSSESALLFCSLPTPSRKQSTADYLEYLEALSSDLPRIVFVKGSGLEVVTAYF